MREMFGLVCMCVCVRDAFGVCCPCYEKKRRQDSLHADFASILAPPNNALSGDQCQPWILLVTFRWRRVCAVSGLSATRRKKEFFGGVATHESC